MNDDQWLTTTMNATQPQQDDAISIIHVPETERYELRDGDNTIGFAAYRKQADRLIFTETEVDDSYAGQGLGSRLAAFAVDDAAAAGQRIEPQCPFIADYLRKHHDYDALIDWPAAEAGAVS